MQDDCCSHCALLVVSLVVAGLLALAHGETFSALEGQLSPELQRVERREQLLHVGAALNQRDEIVPERPFDTGMVAVVIANGLLYFAYNYYSFALLNRITFLAHSALNACRRCVIIVIGSLWFHRPITLQVRHDCFADFMFGWCATQSYLLCYLLSRTFLAFLWRFWDSGSSCGFVVTLLPCVVICAVPCFSGP